MEDTTQDLDDVSKKKENLGKAIDKIQVMIERLRVTEAALSEGREVDSILAGGEWLKLSRTVPVFSFYGEKMADVTLADTELLKTVIDHAHEYKGVLAEADAKQRKRIIQDCANAIRTRAEELARINSKQTGQTLKYSIEQINRSLIAIEEMSEQLRPERVFYENNRMNISIHESAGPCAAFTGRHDAITTTCTLLSLAILTATPIILIPDQRAVMPVLKVVRIFSGGAMPKGAAHVLTGDRKAFLSEITKNKKAASIYLDEESGSEELSTQIAPGAKRLYVKREKKDLFLIANGMPIATIADNITRYMLNRTSPVIVFVEEDDYDALSRLVQDKLKECAKGDPLVKGTDYWSLDDLTLASRRSELDPKPWFGGLQTGKHYIPAVYLSADFDPKLVTKMKNQSLLIFRSTSLNYSLHYASHIRASNVILYTKHIEKSFRTMKELNAEQICINSLPGVHYEELFRLFTNMKKITFGEVG